MSKGQRARVWLTDPLCVWRIWLWRRDVEKLRRATLGWIDVRTVVAWEVG